MNSHMTTTYVYIEKKEKSQYFLAEKKCYHGADILCGFILLLHFCLKFIETMPCCFFNFVCCFFVWFY